MPQLLERDALYVCPCSESCCLEKEKSLLLLLLGEERWVERHERKNEEEGEGIEKPTSLIKERKPHQPRHARRRVQHRRRVVARPQRVGEASEVLAVLRGHQGSRVGAPDVDL